MKVKYHERFIWAHVLWELCYSGESGFHFGPKKGPSLVNIERQETVKGTGSGSDDLTLPPDAPYKGEEKASNPQHRSL